MPSPADPSARARLVLHAGTPKTGTKTLQSAWYAARDPLRAQGVLYPDVDLSHEHKHQWLVNRLMANDFAGFDARVDELHRMVAALRPAQVVLSTEGLYLHWTDFTPAARERLRALAAAFDTTVWMLCREPLSFAVSLYSQVMKNAPSHLTTCYGTARSFEEIVHDPWFAERLRYDRFIHEVEALFGRACVVVQRFSPADTVTQARALLGVDAATLPDAPGRNHGLKAFGLDLMRRLNAAAVPPGERARLVEAIDDLDRLIGGQERLVVSDAAARTVYAHASGAVRYLAARYDIHWPRPSGAGA